jgi:RHH-type proline utilization regulon transcriptional repressor/proline dehydrogenase/delta 1-pyrroline-5-carboxylate dehydrogenase
VAEDAGGEPLATAEVQSALNSLSVPEPDPQVTDLPGPTGESNRLSLVPRGRVLCLGPGAAAAFAQAARALDAGCTVLIVAPGALEHEFAAHGSVAALDGTVAPESLTELQGIAAVMSDAADEALRAERTALAAREGAIVPLVTNADPDILLRHERHLCIDTTAAGGNASLLAEAESAG